MTLTLLLIEVAFDLKRGVVPELIPTTLLVAPERRMLDALLALSRTNEQALAVTDDPEHDHVDLSELEPLVPGADPRLGVAILGGAQDLDGGMTSWELTVGQLKAVRALALEDSLWWDSTGTHNRAVLAYINELSDSTKIIVMQTGQPGTPSN